MPFGRHLEIEANILVLVAKGEVTGDDFVAETRSLLSNQPLPIPYGTIYDLREAVIVGELDAFKWLARKIATADWLPGQRVALLVGGDHEHGLVRMFGALTSDGPVEYRPFRDVDEARAWAAVLPEKA